MRLHRIDIVRDFPSRRLVSLEKPSPTTLYSQLPATCSGRFLFLVRKTTSVVGVAQFSGNNTHVLVEVGVLRTNEPTRLGQDGAGRREVNGNNRG